MAVEQTQINRYLFNSGAGSWSYNGIVDNGVLVSSRLSWMSGGREVVVDLSVQDFVDLTAMLPEVGAAVGAVLLVAP